MRNLTKVLVLVIPMTISFEGIRQFAYYDPPGIATVCMGSTHNVEWGKKYSLEECHDRLDKDMREAIAHVERCQPGLPDNVLAAFADAVYNLGPKIVCDLKQSTAARMLRQGDIEGACNQLPRWNKSRIMGVPVVLEGLVRRREAERQLCLG